LPNAQFQLIRSFEPSEYHYLAARKTCNAAQNRHETLLPIETSRVALAPKPGVEGSDYINASWLNGHNKPQEFVVTQHPDEETKNAFWRMLWDHNAQTIVLLSALNEEVQFRERNGPRKKC
jgi:receptor-type tyrosine-protein phosphatase gamma